MKFTREQMIDLAYTDHDRNLFEIVETQMVDQRRWETTYEIVFKFEDRFFRSQYDLGSTECQESMPYEYDGDDDDMIEVEEVFPKEVTVTQYVTKDEL